MSIDVIADRVLLGRTAAGSRFYLTVETSELAGPKETTEHEVIDSLVRLSMTGEVVNDGDVQPALVGQCAEVLAQLTDFEPPFSAAVAADLAGIWENFHLNDMQAGCVHQTPVWHETKYGSELDLDAVPPCPVTGYKFGHAWLVLPLAGVAQAIADLRAIFDV